MLRIVPTEHLIGVKLQGDYNDLNELYDALSRYLTIYQESTDYPYSDYEYLLSLNYDIRHAYMGTRDVVKVDNHSEHSPKTNLYFSVDIAVPLILYYLNTFQHFLDSYYSVSWFEKYNNGMHGQPYDQMMAEHDRAQIQVFNASVWQYLRSLLGENDANTLFQYFTYNEEGIIFPGMYIDAVLAYYHTNVTFLSEEEIKEFILYIAYCVMDPASTRYKNKNMLACHNQYEKVKKDIRNKGLKLLPSYAKFLTLENKYFGEKMSITEYEFNGFVKKYFGNPDWDNIVM